MRQFTAFLSELDSAYSGLPYYTEVRWLSCSKILKQFWDLKKEVCQFLKNKNQDTTLYFRVFDPLFRGSAKMAHLLFVRPAY